MTEKQLWNSILQMAVTGKLVPQHPEDEPASALLARMEKEKAALIKEKKLKKEKNPTRIVRGEDGRFYEIPIVGHPVRWGRAEGEGETGAVDISDQIPFEIPESWEWTYVGNIAFVTKLAGFEYTKYIAPNLCKEGIPLFKGKNVQDGKLVEQFESYIPEKLSDELNRSQISKKCLLTPYVGTIGNIAIFSGNYKAHLGSNVGKIELIGEGISEEYVLYYLKSCFGYKELTKTKKATAQESISIEAIRNVIIAVPPLAEQERIVEKLGELAPLVSLYGEKERALSEMDASFAGALKKSVLAAAVSGKLLPQDAADEPAAALLTRIEAEKAALIKAKKLKKEKNPTRIVRGRNGSFFEVPVIEHSGRLERVKGEEERGAIDISDQLPFEIPESWGKSEERGKRKEGSDATDITDQLPFEIPESWEWVRLGTVSTYAETKQKIKAADANPDIWELDLEDIEKGGKILAKKTVAECKATGDKTVFYKGDILYSKLRPYLLKILIAPENGICTPEMIPFKMYGDICPEYIIHFLKSPYVDTLVNGTTYGVKMPRVSTETMTGLFVPLPPLAEQERIAARVREIFATLDELH